MESFEEPYVFSHHFPNIHEFAKILSTSYKKVYFLQNAFKTVTLQMDSPLNHMRWNNFHLKRACG